MQRILAGLVTALAVVVLPQYAAAQEGKRPEGPPMFNARAIFNRLDTDKDGKLSFEEFSVSVRRLNQFFTMRMEGWNRPLQGGMKFAHQGVIAYKAEFNKRYFSPGAPDTAKWHGHHSCKDCKDMMAKWHEHHGGKDMAKGHKPPDGKGMAKGHKPPIGKDMVKGHKPSECPSMAKGHKPPVGKDIAKGHKPPECKAMAKGNKSSECPYMAKGHKPPVGKDMAKGHKPPECKAVAKGHKPPEMKQPAGKADSGRQSIEARLVALEKQQAEILTLLRTAKSDHKPRELARGGKKPQHEEEESRHGDRD